MKDLLKKDLAQLDKLNERFHVFVLMKASYAPFPFVQVPVQEISEHIGQYTIVTKEKADE